MDTDNKEDDYVESDNEAVGIHYSLDISTKNRKLTTEQRMVLRTMMEQLVAEAQVKIGFVIEDKNLYTIEANIAASNTGRRALKINLEPDQL